MIAEKKSVHNARTPIPPSLRAAAQAQEPAEGRTVVLLVAEGMHWCDGALVGEAAPSVGSGGMGIVDVQVESP